MDEGDPAVNYAIEEYLPTVVSNNPVALTTLHLPASCAANDRNRHIALEVERVEMVLRFCPRDRVE